jgi:hypothetical protein
LLPFVFATAFAGANGLALGGTAWLLRNHGRHSDWAASLLFSSAALVGSVALLTEIIASLTDTSAQLFPSMFALRLSFVWSVFVGPVLFVTAFLLRAKATPRAVYLLQFFQVLTWALSGAVLLLVSVQT